MEEEFSEIELGSLKFRTIIHYFQLNDSIRWSMNFFESFCHFFSRENLRFFGLRLQEVRARLHVYFSYCFRYDKAIFKDISWVLDKSVRWPFAFRKPLTGARTLINESTTVVVLNMGNQCREGRFIVLFLFPRQ